MSALRLIGHVWAAPLTLAGAVLALLGGARPAGLRGGALDLVAPRRGPLAFFFRSTGVHAYTWGASIVYRDRECLAGAELCRHERVHVRQCLLLGPLMPLAYVGSSLWQLARGRHPYRDNWFEVQARRS
jgi:hypothetical protein